MRTLLGSPKAIGKFRGSIAMSNLGGGVDLGLTGSEYLLDECDTRQDTDLLSRLCNNLQFLLDPSRILRTQ